MAMTSPKTSRIRIPARRGLPPWLRQHAHHLVFLLTIVSLAALLAWWTVFIHTSIHTQKSEHLLGLEKEMRYLALERGGASEHPPHHGPLAGDARFEIVPCSGGSTATSYPLKPFWPDHCLQIRRPILDGIEAKFRSQNLMLIGEAGFFGLVLLLAIIFLYRFVQLEKKTTLEIQRFWERTAHEIKTPITGIKAFLQNLKSRSSEADELAPYINLALRQVSKQEQFAENIISGYHLSSRMSLRDRESISLKEFLSDFFKKSPLRLADAKLRPAFEKRDDVAALAHVHSLKVILDNIVDNAIKYCSPGLVLTVDIRRMKGRAAITIGDNGPGIPADFKENVFQAYKKTEKDLPGTRHGTGMGLDISRRLARHMGGDLKISSGGRDSGSEFSLTLPLSGQNAI